MKVKEKKKEIDLELLLTLGGLFGFTLGFSTIACSQGVISICNSQSIIYSMIGLIYIDIFCLLYLRYLIFKQKNDKEEN